jgi:hypothetical protein
MAYRSDHVSGAKGVRLIKGKEPFRKLVVCAVEYDASPLYHDRRGRIVAELGKLRSGWMVSSAIFEKQTTVLNPESETALGFSNNSIHIQINREDTTAEVEQNQIEPFSQQVSAIVPLLVDELEIGTFVRVGYLERFHFSCDSVEESENWIKKLGLVTVSSKLDAAFHSEVMSISGTITLRSEECRYGITIRSLERLGTIPVGGTGEITIRESRAKHLQREDLLRYLKAKRDGKKNPAYSVSIDVDAYLMDEMDADFRLADFVTNNSSKNLAALHQAIVGE